MTCNCGNKGPKSAVPAISAAVRVPVQNCSKCGKDPCACVEDHTVRIKQESYTTVICVTHTWVMPAVNDCVQLHFNDVSNILSGAVLWNAAVGHLHVRSYDASTGYALLCNRGGDDNAEAGTTFPSEMCFHVGIPVECDCNSDYTGPCLKADFTSPIEGDTGDMSVTNVSGLFVNDIIDVAGYMYRIVAIQDVNTITVKNEGYGAPVGTVIKNDPACSGKPCTVKIQVVAKDDACQQEPVNSGIVLVCDDGVQKPIVGTAQGQVLGWDTDLDKWKLVNAGISDSCTVTTNCVTFDPNVTNYIFYVEDSALFNVGSKFILENIAYTVTEVGEGYIRATRTAPSAISVLEAGAVICVDSEVCELDDWCGQISRNKADIDNTVKNPQWVPLSLGNMSYSGKDEYIVNNVPKLQATTVSDQYKSVSYNTDTTITIPAPTGNTAGKQIVVSGVATISYRGVAYNDSHYREFLVSTPPFSTEEGFVFLIPAKVALEGNVSIAGTPVYTDNIKIRNGFGYTPQSEGTKTSHGPASQVITIPFAATVNSGAVPIKISATVTLENAKLPNPSGNPKTDEAIALDIDRFSINTAYTWTLK